MTNKEVSVAELRLWRLILPGAFVGAFSLPFLCFAQDSPNINVAEQRGDAPGCADVAGFPRVAASIITSCQHANSMEVTMPLQPDSHGLAREKKLRGIYEYREYQLPQIYQQDQAFENLK